MRFILIAAVIVVTASADQLRVTVYDQAHLTRADRISVLDDLRQIFRESRIEIRVVAGDSAAEEATLNTYPAPARQGHELEAACGARRDIALEIAAEAPPSLSKTVLGMAQPLARTGLNVTVFDDHIRDIAFRQNREHAVVLAHAIAHEIGHVLLRSNGHAKWGIMSSVWGKNEYGPMMKSLLFFSREQSRQMRVSLTGSGCPNSPITIE